MAGGSPQPAPPQTTSVTQTNQPPAYLRKPIERGVETLSGLSETPFTYYPGSTVVPFSAQTQAGLQGIESRAQQGAPGVSAAEEYNTSLFGGLTSADNAYIDLINSAIRPRVESAYAGAGRSGASPGAQETYTRALTQGVAPYLAQTREAATKAAPLLDMYGYQPSEQLLGVGGAYEGQAGQRLAEDISRYQFAEEEPWARAQRFLGSAMGLGNTFGTQTGSTFGSPGMMPGSPGALEYGSALGQMALPFAMLASDRRLKTDIKKVNETPVYEYRYRTDPKGTRRLGLMAQDVEKVRPEAVGEIGGYKAVNYGMLLGV